MRKMLMVVPTYFETERLHLRSYQAGDGRWYYPMSLRNRNHLARYEADNPARSLASEDHAEALMRSFTADWQARASFFLGVFEKTTGEFVGQVYIGPVNWALPEFAVGYFADEAHTGRGYITEAVRGTLGFTFSHLQAWRVRLECDDTNTPSLRVAERASFIKEGHLRQNKLNPDGTLSGTLLYGLLRSEYADEGQGARGAGLVQANR
jgi:ribosomal-protein-alanine N-acetyltransferase